MFRYSEDNLGGRALNWSLLFGAALLFVAFTYASLGSATQPVAPQVVATSAPAVHG